MTDKKLHSTLSEKEIKEIKASLEQRLSEIESELDKFTTDDKYEHEEHRPIFPSYGDKNDDNANEIATFTDNLSLVKSLEDTIRDIKGSLEQIKKGTYGICKYCGKPISKARIKIRPASSACISCKNKLQE